MIDYSAYNTEDMLLAALPKYIRDDIIALKDGIRNKSSLLDCLVEELKASINSAMWDNEISKATADYLWDTYI